MPDTATRREVRLGVIRRAAEPRSYNADQHTVELIAATGFAVRRWDWDDGPYMERLAIEDGAVDLERVQNGVCPLLDTHSRWSVADQLGLVESGRIENGQLILSVRFGDTEAARAVEAEVAAGRLRGCSVGYRRDEIMKDVRQDGQIPTHTVTRWALLEVSLVPVPADPDAGVRSEEGLHPCIIKETRAMPPEQTSTAGTPANSTPQSETRTASEPAAPAAETSAGSTPAVSAETETRAAPARGLSAQDALALQDQARALGVDDEQIRSALTDPGATRASVSDAILSRAAARQGQNTATMPAGSAGRVTHDEVQTRRDGIREAIVYGLRASHGARPEAAAAAQPFLRHSLSELAALSLGEREMPRTAAERIDVFQRAFHTTSDFPTLLSGALNVRLEENYRVAAPTYRRIARQMTFMDFRPHEVIRPGDFPQLQKVNEAGEIKFGTFGEKKETAAVAAYGIQFGLSRQLLVNDNLGAIDQVLANQGQSVALFEEITFYAMKGTIGPVLLEDNKAVFHADHGNLAASGGAISDTTLATGRAALRKMKNLSGHAMNLAPKILLVSPDKETEAEKAIAPIVPGQVSAVNPFTGKLEIVVAGQLTGNAWELYTDPSFGTNWVWGLLDGFAAPRLKVEEVFGQQGAKVSLEHDFGVGAQDFRFGYRNPGA